MDKIKAEEKKKYTLWLCAEHLDEAGFLYSQRQYLIKKSAWKGSHAFDIRLEAHLEALSLEGDLAVEACKQLIASKIPGDFYMAARIFCRNRRSDLMGKILEAVTAGNDENLKTVCNGLVEEALFHPQQVRDILAAHSHYTRIVANVAADARIGVWPRMETVMEKLPPKDISAIIRLSGRIRNNEMVPLLMGVLNYPDDAVCFEARLALLRLGKGPEVLNYCRNNLKCFLALGIAGGASEASFLMKHIGNCQIASEVVLCLGLLGKVASIPVLLAALNDESLRESAALALELITGAGLKEEIFIPEKIDIKELFPKELAKLERGEALYPPGEEPGEMITRISQSLDAWKNWVTDHGGDFNPGIRYRNGKPFSPECLVENLRSETLPGCIRQLAYEEMVIRYHKDFPFDTERPAALQLAAISAYEGWAKTQENDFAKGSWYLNGAKKE